VEKSAASAFFPGRCGLHQELQARDIDTVLIVGTVTNVCCESSARDASTLGYRVIMVADLNVGGDRQTRSSTFTVVYRTFGDVRTSTEVAEILARPLDHHAGADAGSASAPAQAAAVAEIQPSVVLTLNVLEGC
jgi:nicotinamidase-related amidase